MVDPGLVGAFWVMSVTFTVLFSAYLTFLRFRLRPDTSTRNQRWAITILAWLFILNTVEFVLFTLAGVRFGRSQVFSISGDSPLSRSLQDLDMITPMLTLSFALVFPRARGLPATQWRLFSVAALLAVVAVAARAGLHYQTNTGALSPQEVTFWNGFLIGAVYTVGWFIPLYLWIPQYTRERNDTARLVLTVTCWGFLAYPTMNRVYEFGAHLPALGSGSWEVSVMGTVQLALLGFILFLLLRTLWRLRGRWTHAERIHLAFLVVFFSVPLVGLAVIPSAGPADSTQSTAVYSLYLWFVAAFPWTVLRPALLSVALLPLQLTAPGTRVERDLAFLGAVTGGSLVAGLPASLSGWSPVGIAAGIVLGALCILPLFRVLQRAAGRVVGTPGPEALPHRRAADIYSLLLQTAVVDGRIVEPADEVPLAYFRRRLGIGAAEHEAFLLELRERAPVHVGKAQIRHVYVVHSDGRLLCHAGTDIDVPDDPVALAATTRAIHAGAQTTLGGAQGESSMRHEGQMLLLSVKEPIILAADVVGTDVGQVRDILDDWIRLLHPKYATKVRAWDGTSAALQGLEDELRRIIAWSKALLA